MIDREELEHTIFKNALITTIYRNPHIIDLNDYRHTLTDDEYVELDRVWFVAKLQKTPPSIHTTYWPSEVVTNGW